MSACPLCPLARCAGRCVCTVDGRDVAHHADAEYCPDPAGPRFGTATAPPAWADVPLAPTAPPAPAPPPLDWTTKGPPLWHELHRRPLDWTPGDDDSQWLERFAAGLPCGDCRNHFRELLKTDPADFGSAASYFASTHRWHVGVNNRLGKPSPTLDEAKRLWGY